MEVHSKAYQILSHKRTCHVPMGFGNNSAQSCDFLKIVDSHLARESTRTESDRIYAEVRIGLCPNRSDDGCTDMAVSQFTPTAPKDRPMELKHGEWARQIDGGQPYCA